MAVIVAAASADAALLPESRRRIGDPDATAKVRLGRLPRVSIVRSDEVAGNRRDSAALLHAPGALAAEQTAAKRSAIKALASEHGSALNGAGEPNITLKLRLEDSGREKGELALWFSLPGTVDFQCKKLVLRRDVAPGRIDITILGIAPVPKPSLCFAHKDPPPISEHLLLPEEGLHEFAFHWGSRSDRYGLAINDAAVSFTPLDPPTFTAFEDAGSILRVGGDWLWVEVSFLGLDSFEHLCDKRDAFYGELKALGATAFVPPAGKYLLNGGIQRVPTEEPRRGGGERTVEQRFFRWQGDWKVIEDLVKRFARYDPPVHYRSRNMGIWVHQRDRVTSTYRLRQWQ